MAKKKDKAPPAEQKTKDLTVKLVPRERPEGGISTPYQILERMVKAVHETLAGARFAILWRMSKVAEDADGTVEFCRIQRLSDLYREISDFDFALVITKAVWDKAVGADDIKRLEAAIDHALTACQVVTKDGEPIEDERGRPVYALRKPVKVFPENVGRFGLWNGGKVAEAFVRFQQKPLPGMADAHAGGKKRGKKFSEPALDPPGTTSTTTPGGIGIHDPDAIPPAREAVGR